MASALRHNDNPRCTCKRHIHKYKRTFNRELPETRKSQDSPLSEDELGANAGTTPEMLDCFINGAFLAETISAAAPVQEEGVCHVPLHLFKILVYFPFFNINID